MPLLDVMFILLIFFAVSSTFAKQSRIMNLDLPKSTSKTKESEAIVISINNTNNYFVNNKEIKKTELKQRFLSEMAKRQQVSIILEADKNTDYNEIIYVLNTSQDCGIFNIQLKTSLSFQK